MTMATIITLRTTALRAEGMSATAYTYLLLRNIAVRYKYLVRSKYSYRGIATRISWVEKSFIQTSH